MDPRRRLALIVAQEKGAEEALKQRKQIEEQELHIERISEMYKFLVPSYPPWYGPMKPCHTHHCFFCPIIRLLAWNIGLDSRT